MAAKGTRAHGWNVDCLRRYVCLSVLLNRVLPFQAHSPPLQPVPFEALISQMPALEEEDFSQLPPAHWEC